MKKYILTEKELNKLSEGYLTSEALEQGGVNNWLWYGESMREYFENNAGADCESFYDLVDYIMERDYSPMKE